MKLIWSITSRKSSSYWYYWQVRNWIMYVYVWCGNQLFYAVGFYRGELPFGPFWHDDFKFKMKYVGGGMARICAFARCLQEELDVADSDRLYLWLKSFRDSNDYLTMHRLIVRRVGHLLNIDMDDHDLTKSRIAQIALGFLWHWSGENDQSSHMKKLALDTVHAGHLEVEDHHPEHEKVGVGNEVRMSGYLFSHVIWKSICMKPWMM